MSIASSVIAAPTAIGEAAFLAELDAMAEAGEAEWVTLASPPPDPNDVGRLRERLTRYVCDVRTWATGDRDPAVRERLVRRSARLERDMRELWGP